MEIQQMGFDGKRILSERGTIPNVRDRIKAFFANPRPSDVYTVFGRQLFVAADVDGRDRVFGAETASTARSGPNTERARQQKSCAADVPLADQLTNACAGDGFASHNHLRIRNDLEPKLVAQLRKQSDIPGGLVPEAKVVTFVNFYCLQPVTKNLLRKFSRTQK